MIKYLRAFLVMFVVLTLIYPWVWVFLLWKNKISEKRKFKLARLIIRGCDFAFGAKYEMINRALIDHPGKVLFYGNHQSMYDILSMISRSQLPMAALAKKEVRKFPWVGNIAEMIGCTFIDRDDMRQSMRTIKKTTQLVSEGRRFFIFPEGTRTRDQARTIGEFKPGSFKVALESEATIIPFAIEGAYKVITGKYPIRKTKVKIIFGEPIPFSQYQDTATTELADLVREKVISLHESIK